MKSIIEMVKAMNFRINWCKGIRRVKKGYVLSEIERVKQKKFRANMKMWTKVAIFI